MNYTKTALAAAMLLAALPTLADEAPDAAQEYTFIDSVKTGKPLTNFRLRYEYVDQGGKAEEANAWTLRSLIGWQTAPFHNFSVAAQLIDVGRFNDEFYDNSNGSWGRPTPTDKKRFPVVADPDDTDINQLFVEWTGIRNTKVRLGRQSLKLDNVRMVGNVEFRQVMQVYDGVALENKSLPDTEIYLGHFERVKQISAKLRSGDLEILHATYRFNPAESITAYGYLQDMPSNGQNIYDHTTKKYGGTGFADNSSGTWGLRADGSHKINDDWKVLYTAEYARQNDYRDGDDRIDAHYWRLGAGAGWGTWYMRLDREMLSSNDGQYGFQTPLGTNHLFQGWADLFLITPKQGIEDTFLSFGGKVSDVQLMGEYHWINADDDFKTTGDTKLFTGQHYGKELDLSAAYAYDKNWSGKLEYARFQEDECYVGTGKCVDSNASRKRDTDKFWLTLMYTL